MSVCQALYRDWNVTRQIYVNYTRGRIIGLNAIPPLTNPNLLIWVVCHIIIYRRHINSFARPMHLPIYCILHINFIPKPIIMHTFPPKKMQQIVGHYQEDDAYILKQFPAYSATNTWRKYWVETREGKGQRFAFKTLNPVSGEWSNTKQNNYHDIVVMRKDINPESRTFGFVFAQEQNLADIPDEHMRLFAERFSYTLYQRDIILEELKRRKLHFMPNWKTDPEINLLTVKRIEIPPSKWELMRAKDPVSGIPIESEHDAEKNFRREQRKKWTANAGAKSKPADDHNAARIAECEAAGFFATGDPEIDSMTLQERIFHRDLS